MAAKVNSKFWENKRVFITGNTGFKGCWLSHWLFEMGATIKGYSLKSNSDISMFNLTTNVKEFETDINNILDFEKLKKKHGRIQSRYYISFGGPTLSSIILSKT